MRRVANDKVKQHLHWNGLNVEIEWPRGDTREYLSTEGFIAFSTEMYCAYGFIKATNTSDGEEMDVYVGSNPGASSVYSIEQLVVSGSYEHTHEDAEPGALDEYKYMLGFSTRAEAERCYVAHMSAQHLGRVMTLSLADFKFMLRHDAGPYNVNPHKLL